MATQKPISTISYNSEAFLREKLENWRKAHIIQSYQYICHKGEDGDKDHIHLRLEPNKKLDAMDLTDSLKEYVRDNDKPLGVRPWRPSKEEDWFLYVVHDKAYMELKYGGGEKGEKLPYKWQDIRVPEDYDCEVAFIRAKATLEHTSPNLMNRLKGGERAVTLVSEGNNPFLVNSLLHMLKASDYERLQYELCETRDRLHALLHAVSDMGIEVYWKKDGSCELHVMESEEE